MTLTPTQCRSLIAAVERLQHHIEELGCTCADNAQRITKHVRRYRGPNPCTGAKIAARYNELVRRTKFQLEY